MTRSIIGMLLFITAQVLSAGDAAPLPTAVHRIVGLCYPERVEDLKFAFRERTDVTLVSVDYEHAEATLAYDPKRVSADSLRGIGGNKGFEVRPRSTVPADQLTRIAIAVVGLDCKGCAMGTYNAIARIEGVEQATVSYKDGKVSVLIDPARTNQAALEDALKKANVTLAGK